MAVYVVRREWINPRGERLVRFLVRWQLGRADPQVHLGTLKTLTAARERVRWAELELAAGRAPSLERLRESLRPRPRMGLARAVEDYLEARVDAAASTRRQYRSRAQAALDYFGDRPVEAITTRQVQAWIVSADVAPWTIRGYVSMLRRVLEHAGVEADPCDERRLHYPRLADEAKRLPTRVELAAVYAELDAEDVPVVLALEHLGLRINEAVAMRSADVDYPRGRVLVGSKSREAGRTRRRWVGYEAAWCEWSPAEGAWSLYAKSAGTLRLHLADACAAAGVRIIKPHDLRHLHASRCLHYGWLSPAQIAERLGHASPKTTLATYTHLVPPEHD